MQDVVEMSFRWPIPPSRHLFRHRVAISTLVVAYSLLLCVCDSMAQKSGGGTKANGKPTNSMRTGFITSIDHIAGEFRVQSRVPGKGTNTTERLLICAKDCIYELPEIRTEERSIPSKKAAVFSSFQVGDAVTVMFTIEPERLICFRLKMHGVSRFRGAITSIDYTNQVIKVGQSKSGVRIRREETFFCPKDCKYDWGKVMGSINYGYEKRPGHPGRKVAEMMTYSKPFATLQDFKVGDDVEIDYKEEMQGLSCKRLRRGDTPGSDPSLP